MPSSKLKEALARILEREGYIAGWDVSKDDDAARAAAQDRAEVHARPQAHDLRAAARLEARPPGVLGLERRAPRARRHGHRHPLDQPGAHDRPRGASAPRGRRGPLPGLVTELSDVSNRQEAHHRSRAASTSRSTAATSRSRARRGPSSTTCPRRSRSRARATSCSSRVPTTSARTARCTASPARWSPTWSTGVSEGFSRELEIVGVGYRAAAAGPRRLELQVGYSHPVAVDAPEGVEFEVPAPDPHHGARLRQAARRPGRRRHPQDPQARALQGQGHPLRRRACAAQGRQVGEVAGRGTRQRCRTVRSHGTAATGGSARRSGAPRRARASRCSARTSTSTRR